MDRSSPGSSPDLKRLYLHCDYLTELLPANVVFAHLCHQLAYRLSKTLTLLTGLAAPVD